MELTNYKAIMIFKYLRAAQGGRAKSWLSKAGVQCIHVMRFLSGPPALLKLSTNSVLLSLC